VAQFNPRGLGSFFVTSYDSQGYGGGIRNLNLYHSTQQFRIKQSVALFSIHLLRERIATCFDTAGLLSGNNYMNMLLFIRLFTDMYSVQRFF
jgi:hypothetical protein